MRGWKVWVEPSAGKWRTRWAGKYGTGQQTFLYKADAREYADDKRREFELLDVGKATAPKAQENFTVGQAADRYLTYSKKEKAPRTFRNFDAPAIASLRAHLKDGTLLRAVQPGAVQDWKHSLAETATALMWFRQACAFFNYSVSMRWITESPAKGLKKPPEGEGGRAMTDEELVKLMGAAPEALYRTGSFSLNTMLRIEEVTLFDWSWVRYFGDAWVGVLPWQVRKTRAKVKRDCIFPLNHAARAVMGERKSTGRVFPWPKSTIQHQFTATRRKVGLPEDISFHSFRHTGASRYLKNGHMEDLLENGSGLWKDARSLLRYVHVDVDTLIPRFSGLKYPDFAPNWLPTSENRPVGSDPGG